MTEQDIRWFNALSEQRKAFRETTFANNFDEIWGVITSPYSDQAHFVYELLQNADDCEATEVEFELMDGHGKTGGILPDRGQLVFKHNGSKRFSISDPDRDATRRDSEKGVLGHVNAITGVSNSTKKENSIGKFGIGFKSVFLYTATPHIYDDSMCFKIEDFIVPTLLETDYPERKKGWTVFVFPFNRQDKNAPDNPVEDVFQKLQRLILPTFFLRNLKTIKWKYGKVFGSFSKEKEVLTLGKSTKDRFEASRVLLKKEISAGDNSEKSVDAFLMFSRKLPSSDLFYSVAFGLDGKDNIRPVEYAPFCYFPTKVDAHLKFVVNAPFLLTSDRAGISEATDAQKRQNQDMLDLLAKLLADSIVGLRDLSEMHGRRYLSDSLIVEQIIPLLEPKVAGWEHLNLKKFYTEPLEIFKGMRVIPCDDGYCEKFHAYVAEYMHMTESFTDEDLQAFTGDSIAKWIFKGVAFSEANIRGVTRDVIVPYIKKILDNRGTIAPEDILTKAQGDFIESRSADIAWLNKFYQWVMKLSRKLQYNCLRYRILLDQHGQAVAVVNDRREHQLFLPIEGNTTFSIIHPELHKLESVRELEKALEMRPPSPLDVVASWIEKARHGSAEEKDGCVKSLIKLACGNGVAINVRQEILKGLKNPQVGQFKSMAEGQSFKPASELYWPSIRLQEFLGAESAGQFIDQNHYIGLGDDENLKSLLTEVGISDKIHLELETFAPQTSNFSAIVQLAQQKGCSGRAVRFTTPRCLCIEQRLSFIRQQVNEGRINDPVVLASAQWQSQQIWEILNDIVAAYSVDTDVMSAFQSRYVYRQRWARGDTEVAWGSQLYNLLVQVPWIWGQDGSFHKAGEISTALLRDEFKSQPTYRRVCDLLDIRTVNIETVRQTIAGLPESDQQAYELGHILQELGIRNESDVRRAIQLLKTEQASKPTSFPLPPDNRNPVAPIPPGPGQEDIQAKVRRSRELTQKYKEKKRKERPEGEQPEATPMLPPEDDDVMQPQPVNFQKKMEDLLRRQQGELAQLHAEVELQAKAVEAEEYSYAWLKSRIDLEIRANGAEDGEKREASVSFAKMEREEGTENMFILSATSDPIPQWFEEEVNQRLTLRIPGQRDIETVIESMSVMSFRLRAKIRILPGMENIDYSKVVEAKTVATRPDFLLASLKEGVEALGYEENYNLKENLPENIKFVFGPPGTGKTTYLAREEIIPLARNEKQPHVLVLTPTNKAADVLTNRIIKECGGDEDYKDWLTRFGMTLDPALQDSPVARAKDVEIKNGRSAVVVATIIRFAYDAFTSMGGVKMSEIKWDYLIVDEASMIPLMQILYPIYKCKENGTKFIIAGDPMQIAPVVMSDLSVGENIYTMVKLENFAAPTTEPRQYEVVRLQEQFRSVPCIGRIFSEFAYGGLLRHHRAAAEEHNLVVNGVPAITPLTVMRFPVSRFESIFKIKLLGKKSSYQIYSALFVFEYICKLAEGLRTARRSGFRIGVISPYRAQANIVERLVARLDKERLEGVEVHVGTVHGFQGDECEMIIALLNPPQGMGRTKDSFINDKKILNVAISRARDYLVLAIPDENTRNLQFLRGPLKIYGLMKQTPGVFSEVQTPCLEKEVWGDKDYIEKNTFSTGHQNVNVYETPEKRFEVRSEDVAIDIHFRPDRLADKQDASFVSERERLEIEVKAEEQARKEFILPEGFHLPRSDEHVCIEKRYYIIGQDDPILCKSETEEIDPSQILAIED